MSQKMRTNRRPNPPPKPGHWPHHHWWDNDWYWDDWYYDDWYWDDDWYYMSQTPKPSPKPNPGPSPKPMGKMGTNGYSCSWDNMMYYQKGYNDGFVAGIEYASKEPTPTPEPTPPATE